MSSKLILFGSFILFIILLLAFGPFWDHFIEPHRKRANTSQNYTLLNNRTEGDR